MAEWTPNLTRGLWGIVQGAVRDGASLADVRGAARAAGEAPDAATLAHLYSRAVGGEAMRAAESDYSGRVDRETYLARRPAGSMIADLPKGFSLSGAYRQVVQLHGFDPLTGAPADQYINVQWDRLLSRGEALDMAIGAGEHYLAGPITADYVVTWRKARST